MKKKEQEKERLRQKDLAAVFGNDAATVSLPKAATTPAAAETSEGGEEYRALSAAAVAAAQRSAAHRAAAWAPSSQPAVGQPVVARPDSTTDLVRRAADHVAAVADSVQAHKRATDEAAAPVVVRKRRRKERPL